MHKGNIKRYALSDKGIVKDAGGAVESMQVVLQEISRWSKGQFTGNEYFLATLKEGKERQIILTPKEKELSAMISNIVITLSADRPEVQDGFGIKTAILVGAPIPRPAVHNGPLERIINIYGSEDKFYKGEEIAFWAASTARFSPLAIPQPIKASPL